MKIKSKNQTKTRTVIIISFFWTISAALLFICEYFFVLDLIDLKKLSGTYEFWPDFLGITVLGFICGLVFGYLLVFRLSSFYSKKSFVFGIIISAIIFVFIYFSLAVIGLFLMNFLYLIFHLGISKAFANAAENVRVNVFAPSFFIYMCIWAIFFAFIQFMLQVRDKFGPGILWKFISGKYYHPREEERIFMFLDLKSATTIAEKIGNKNYFNLLNELYSEITPPITASMGEIYQYVGDEVVVSWLVPYGLEEYNCILCFFRINQILERKRKYYIKKYDTIPSFKAGIHIGEATVGEIGIIKKDIVFSGDVLNTTSRIQHECNNYNVNLLLSSSLLKRMPMSEEFEKIFLGEIQLKGKKEKIELNTINLNFSMENS